MNLKPIHIFFLCTFWFILCWYWYVVKIKGFELFSDLNASKIEIIKPFKTQNDVLQKPQPAKDSGLKVTIYFKYNSKKPEDLMLNDSLINEVYKFQKNTGNNLFIRGFASSENTNSENYKLGRIRAWVIKSILLNKGIKSANLITTANEYSENNKVEITSE